MKAAKKAGRPVKRKASGASTGTTGDAKDIEPQAEPTTSRTKRVKPELLTQANYVPKLAAERVLSCGEGPQLGHPGRNTTKKPRHVTALPEGLTFVQAVAGGVHSFLLTSDGQVYGCGVNEKGTVPVEGVDREETTDEFKLLQIPENLKKHGKIVMLAAGASFTAALTEKGTVFAWGNLRDASGNIDSHSILQDMQKEPTVISNHKSTFVVKIAAGENHLLMLSNQGEVLSFGDGTQGQLGRTMRTSHIRSNYMVDNTGTSRRLVVYVRGGRKDSRTVDIMAGGYWSLVRIDDGRWFAFGLNNYGQIGVPLPAEAEEADGENPGDNMQADETDYHVYLPKVATEFGAVEDITHIQGVHHTVCRSSDGHIYAMGKNTDNALGLDTWTGNDDNEHWRYTTLQKVPVPVEEGDKVAGVTATIGCSIAWTENGDAYAFGCDTVGQTGLGFTDGEIAPSPEKITSAHLNGFKILSVSLADTHALLLATKKEEEASSE